jgi:colanic acid biosynthesis glycosyl transferase WcaI
MRILFATINYWPEKTGIAPVVTWRAEALAARGHQVTVATGFPYYPEWRVAAPYRGRLAQREERNGVEVLRSWLWVPKKVTSARRVLFEGSFLATSALRAWAAPRPDLLVIVSPPLGLGMTAIALSRWWGVPYIFDVMDLQPDAAADLGMMPAPALKLLYWLESAAYRHAALVTTLTGGIQKRIVSKGISEGKVGCIPLAADDALLNSASPDGGEFRRAHGLGDRRLVLHAGNMGVKQGLEVILGAAQRTASRQDILYLLVGDGARGQALRDEAATLRLENVLFLPLQPAEMFPHMLAAAEVALVTQQRTVADIVFPSKAVPLLAGGCPVVASVSGESEIARVISESGAGVVVEPESPESLADAVVRLCDDAGARRAMSDRGRQYARQHWAPDHVAGLMEAEYLRVAGLDAEPRRRAATAAGV